MKPRMRPITEKEIQQAQRDLYPRTREIAEKLAPIFEKSEFTWCMYDGESRVPDVDDIESTLCSLVRELYYGEPHVHVSTGRIAIEVSKYVYNMLGTEERRAAISVRVYLNAETVIV